MTAEKIRRLKWVLWMIASLPFWRLFIGAWTDHLGTNPIETITRSTGTWTLVFLCITLAMTPLRALLGWSFLIAFRRSFGLIAFSYAILHLGTWVWFDQWFDLGDMVRDVIKRPFITVGMLAFLLLIPLAVTSNSASMKRLGRHWKSLHRLVYLIVPLGVLHFLWLVKLDMTEPLIYGAIVAGLLGWRIVVAARKRANAPKS